jgi:hypothetical protein
MSILKYQTKFFCWVLVILLVRVTGIWRWMISLQFYPEGKREPINQVAKIGRNGSQSKSSDTIVGAQSKSSAAQVKANIDHPLCGIVAGTRRRKKNPKYL